MAASNVSLFFVVILSTIYVGSAAPAPPPAPGPKLPCLQQLLPCEAFLKQPSTPTPACCIPMNELVKNQLPCLCNAINDKAILQSLNITQADALRLANSCHANADASMCKNGTVSPGASPAVPLTPPASTASNSTAHKSNDADGVRSQFGVSAMIAFFLFLIVSVSDMGFF